MNAIGLTQDQTKQYVILPDGWRWRKLGEWVQSGDYLFDLRSSGPVMIREGWVQGKSHHAVATQGAHARKTS